MTPKRRSLPALFARVASVLFVCTVVIVASTAATSATGAATLLAPADAPSRELPSEGPDALRQRYVTVDADYLEGPGSDAQRHARTGDPLMLDLFDDRRLPAVRTGLVKTAADGTVWKGSVAGRADSTVTLSLRQGKMAGTIWYGDELYQITHAGEGVHAVRQVDLANMPPYAEPIAIDARDHGASGAATVSGDTMPDQDHATIDGLDAVEDDGSVIDLMVVWTPAARSAQGGTAAMEALVDLAIVETNDAYNNSAIAPRVNLVHATEVNYTESGDFSTDLGRLRDPTDGYMDSVHSLRDTYHADQVTLISNSTQYCGIGYLMSTVSSSFDAYAFSVVYRGCATGYYSFGHELGHNQGSHHDRASASSTPAYAYSYGYRDATNNFRTIMAYDCSPSCARVQHFSNPDVLYNGEVTGIDHDVDPVNSADNARSIDGTAYTVANFRVGSTAQPPAAPSGLAASATSESSIALTWTDNATDESGFTVERSLDGSSGWSEVANLGADTVSHTDSGLDASTTYYYRVRAYNSGGVSAWSNVANATTDAAPAYVDQVASGEQTAAGTTSGSYLDTGADDGVSQSITEVESSGGPPWNRYSLLEHTWTIPVVAGDAVTLFANAWAPASSDGDSFQLAWSTDNSTFTDLFTIDATTDGTDQSASLPASTSGTVYVRVRDTNRMAGNTALDTVYVDHLYIRSENSDGGSPPSAPSDLSASAPSSGQVDLVWTDNAVDEYGFEVQRSTDGLTWSEVGTTSADVTSFSDTSVASATSYDYRVRAYNGAGTSAWSNTAQVTTPAGASISLSATGYKVKGVHTIDLTWSGASGTDVDIFRDGSLLTTTANDGAHTDSTGNKGGGSYNYEVCEAGTTTCSETVTVNF